MAEDALNDRVELPDEESRSNLRKAPIWRLWIDTYPSRPDHCLRWYGQLVSWIRRRCHRDRHGVYWGPDAEERWRDHFEAA